MTTEKKLKERLVNSQKRKVARRNLDEEVKSDLRSKDSSSRHQTRAQMADGDKSLEHLANNRGKRIKGRI